MEQASPTELAALRWPMQAREKQLAPDGDWDTWLVLAGRGFGKTRAGGEWVEEYAQTHPGCRIALVARIGSDVRDVLVEGESGLMSYARPEPLRYEPSKRRLTWPNGSMAVTYTAEEPDQLRGPQHHAAWCDELAAWQYPDAWDQLRLGLRLGTNPRCCVTTTPRPTKQIRELMAATGTVVTRGSSYENRENLAPTFFETIIRKYEGTRLGRQELDAELLEDVPGALWTLATLDAHRVREVSCELVRIVVGVDPAATSSEDSDETGIVVVGKGSDGHGYVLADVSLRGTPDEWGRRVVRAFHDHSADRIVAEANNGGEMVSHVLRTVDAHVPVRLVHASRGKLVRAEPVAALYEQGRVHHVGALKDLEDQMTTYVPDQISVMETRPDGSHIRRRNSPDRMDALVWAVTELFPNRSSVSPVTVVVG